MDDRASDIQIFEAYFRRHYKFFCLLADQIIHDTLQSEDIVQEFFTQLWQKRALLREITHFQAYGSRSIRNSCFHFKKTSQIFVQIEPEHFSEDFLEGGALMEYNSLGEALGKEELDKTVLSWVEELPFDRKTIFLGVVVEEKTYQQMADHLGISINTVKTQMKRAYAFLRKKAADDPIGFLLISLIWRNF